MKYDTRQAIIGMVMLICLGRKQHIPKPIRHSTSVTKAIRLTAAINRAKDSGDIETLREIAEDPHGFILRQGWSSLDFSDVEELAQLRRLHETLQKEIATVTESLKQLRESPDYELCQLSEQRPGVLDELAAERKKQLEIENADLEKQADQLASEIKKLTNPTPST
jgi:DNA polymerase-3 subunit epsilon